MTKVIFRMTVVTYVLYGGLPGELVRERLGLVREFFE